jgi:hypothetical protein
MNTDGYTIKNILRKVYTTNENAPWRIAENERRYFVKRVCKNEEDGEEGSEWNSFLRREIVPMRTNVESLSDLMWFFMHRDISTWDPGAPVPITEDMLDMVEAGESKKHTVAGQLYASLSAYMWAKQAYNAARHALVQSMTRMVARHNSHSHLT